MTSNWEAILHSEIEIKKKKMYAFFIFRMKASDLKKNTIEQ